MTSSDERALKKAKMVSSTGKVMATVFWNTQGMIFTWRREKLSWGNTMLIYWPFNSIELKKKRLHLAKKNVIPSRRCIDSFLCSKEPHRERVANCTWPVFFDWTRTSKFHRNGRDWRKLITWSLSSWLDVGIHVMQFATLSLWGSLLHNHSLIGRIALRIAAASTVFSGLFFLFSNLKKWLGGKRFTSNEVITETEAYFAESVNKLYFLEELKNGRVLRKVYPLKRGLCWKIKKILWKVCVFITNERVLMICHRMRSHMYKQKFFLKIHYIIIHICWCLQSLTAVICCTKIYLFCLLPVLFSKRSEQSTCKR